MDTLQDLRETIRTKRKSLKMRQEDLARIASVSLPTLKALEQGRIREIGFSKLTRILAALGLELRVQEANSGRPTLEQLRDEGEEVEWRFESGRMA